VAADVSEEAEWRRTELIRAFVNSLPGVGCAVSFVCGWLGGLLPHGDGIGEKGGVGNQDPGGRIFDDGVAEVDFLHVPFRGCNSDVVAAAKGPIEEDHGAGEEV
jgi:hypothetical protein